MKKITVGITEGRKYENYLRWFTQIPDVEVIQLSPAKNNVSDVQKCNGIVLTGGEDIHPEFYNKPEYIDQYQLSDFNKERDLFELEVLAQSRQLAILGICRGLQLINVYFGGTLIPDIPSFGKPDHTKFREGEDRFHIVNAVPNTLLETIAGHTGEVNSAHHQSVDKAGEGLIVNALSEDGIIEGMERKDKQGQAFLLMVQWHPERMTNPVNSFSGKVRDSFLEAIKKV